LLENRAPNGLTREEARLQTTVGPPPERLPRGAAYEAADVLDSAYADGQIAEEAVRRLQQAAQTPDKPFFLAVGFLKPHLPFCAPQKYWELYEPTDFELQSRQTPPDGAPGFAPTNWGELRQYANMPESGDLTADQQRALIHGYHAAISYMDAQLGRVLDALAATGLDKTTLIVLWGDHGWHLGDHGMWCKHTNYEQAARIPLIVVAPGVTPPDAASASLVESVDIYPTLCELANLPTPTGLDGASFTAALRDPTATTKDAIYHAYPRRNMIGRAVRTARYRLVEWKRPGARPESAIVELYDYECDPGETVNLASQHPEIVADLRQILAQQPEAKPQWTASATRQPPRADRRPRRAERANP
jgi:iduronate 2-sulfatase